jgi:hypothetical protein
MHAGMEFILVTKFGSGCCPKNGSSKPSKVIVSYKVGSKDKKSTRSSVMWS